MPLHKGGCSEVNDVEELGKILRINWYIAMDILSNFTESFIEQNRVE